MVPLPGLANTLYHTVTEGRLGAWRDDRPQTDAKVAVPNQSKGSRTESQGKTVCVTVVNWNIVEESSEKDSSNSATLRQESQFIGEREACRLD